MSIIQDLSPGDRAYTYVWTGGDRQDPMPFTVVRVNRVTVTVDLDDGPRRRLPHADVIDRWDYPVER